MEKIYYKTAYGSGVRWAKKKRETATRIIADIGGELNPDAEIAFNKKTGREIGASSSYGYAMLLTEDQYWSRKADMIVDRMRPRERDIAELKKKLAFEEAELGKLIIQLGKIKARQE